MRKQQNIKLWRTLFDCAKLSVIEKSFVQYIILNYLVIYTRYTGEATGNRYINVRIIIQMTRRVKFICFFLNISKFKKLRETFIH